MRVFFIGGVCRRRNLNMVGKLLFVMGSGMLG